MAELASDETADDVHIHLVVHDASAMRVLAALAQCLRQDADQTDDASLRAVLLRTHDYVSSLVTAYTELQAHTLAKPAAFANALPALCADLAACFLQPAAPEAGVLSALAPEGSGGRLLAQGVRYGAGEDACELSAMVSAGAEAEWVVALRLEPERPRGRIAYQRVTKRPMTAPSSSEFMPTPMPS